MRAARFVELAGASPKTPSIVRSRGMALPPLDQVKLENLRTDQLRAAVRSNLVTFPSQVPVFERHDRPDLQRQVVQLYFVLGWSCATIAERYGMVRQRIGQVLNTWKRRAVGQDLSSTFRFPKVFAVLMPLSGSFCLPLFAIRALIGQRVFSI